MPGPDGIAFPVPPEFAEVDLSKQTPESGGAEELRLHPCHQASHDPHYKETVRLGCVDCHGGDPTSHDKRTAHVWPRLPEVWATSANPVRSYTAMNHESPEFIRFVNPGDFRIAHLSCGTVNCHPNEVLQNRMSMMTHGRMLWGAALYNNGSYPLKQSHFGESYSMDGTPQRLQTVPPPNDWEIKVKGVVPFLDPLPHFEASQPGNVLRIFERGGGSPPRSASPTRSRSRAGPRPSSASEAWGPGTGPTPCSSAWPRPGSSTRPSTSSGPTTTRATTAPAAAPPATSSTPTTATRSTPARSPAPGTWGSASTPTRPSPRTSADTRSSTASSTGSRPASASSATSTPAPTS